MKKKAAKKKVGRPPAFREASLPRVSRKSKEQLEEVAAFYRCSLARAIEIAAEVAAGASLDANGG